MNVTTISTPERNAYRIGADTLNRIQREAERIANIDLASFLSDVNMLAVALYASDPSLCASYLPFHKGDYRRRAAEKAKGLHLNPKRIPRLICDGYFHRNLRALLEIGNHNSDFGAKLVPVFACMLEHKDGHCLDPDLISDIGRFIAKRDFVDGFTIISQTVDNCCVMPSIWGREVA